MYFVLALTRYLIIACLTKWRLWNENEHMVNHFFLIRLMCGIWESEWNSVDMKSKEQLKEILTYDLF